jgi:hypothetical protein
LIGAGWGQSGYVGGQGAWGYGSHPIYYHFVIYEHLPTWHRPLV